LSRPYIEIFFVDASWVASASDTIRIVERAAKTLKRMLVNLPKNGALVLFGNPNAEKPTLSDARIHLQASCRFGMG